MTSPDERFVGLEGSSNFRDLGGWSARGGRRVRRGLVYRSDGLHELSARDVQHLRERLGIRSVIDLARRPRWRTTPMARWSRRP